MWYNEQEYVIRLGGTLFINVPNILVYKDKPIFTVQRNESNEDLGITFDILEKEGNKIAAVKQGRIYPNKKEYEDRYVIHKDPDAWILTDTTTKERICTINKRKAANGAELDVSVNLYLEKDRLFQATPTQFTVGTNMFSGMIIQGCLNGIVLG